MPDSPPNARTLLQPAGETPVGWATFDPDWYLRTYPEIRNEIADADGLAAQQVYLEFGQRLGHSPNRFFDEAGFLSRFPDAAARVRVGQAESGFDAYCRHRGRHPAPHWLFDEVTYREASPDITDDTLQDHGLLNGYQHYLQSGDREGRVASRLFDPATYLAHLPAEEAAQARSIGAFAHFLARIETNADPVRTTPRFDPAWYLDRYPAVAAGIEAGRWRCALHHYLTNDTPAAFDPLPLFSECHYLARNPDVLAAVANRRLRNGYEHFLRSGLAEGRAPGDGFDVAYYTGLAAVRDDLLHGLAANAFDHFLTIGQAAGLSPVPPGKLTPSQALFRIRAETLVPCVARHPMDFGYPGVPELSVLMVLHDDFALTMQAVSSLRRSFSGRIQLILVDSGSADETRFISRYVHGAQVVRFEDDIGVVRGGNAALVWATADAVLFLGSETELGPGAAAIALARLMSDPGIGAVGGKIIAADGTLREAGCIIWSDGSTDGYMRGAAASAPEANFVRDADFCSGAFLMARTDAVRRLGGFADELAHGGYEDADLCVRLAGAGYRVVYDPAVLVHDDGRGADESARGRARDIFAGRNRVYLESRLPRNPGSAIFARSAAAGRRRILFIEDQVPLRLLGAGYVRSNDVLWAMASLGHAVTLFPLRGGDQGLGRMVGDLPDTVEVMHDRSFDVLEAFLAGRPGYFDMIWIARTDNLARVRPVLDRLAAPMVVDTGMMGPGREAMLADAAACAAVVALTREEAEVLRARGLSAVSVIGPMMEARPTPRSYAQRSGMLFVGAIHAPDSANLDGLIWFVDEVLPLIEAELGWETRLTIAGYLAPGMDLSRFENHPRITLRGVVADLTPLYNAHRMFVAPIRYASGEPYKVLEAASYGLPVVATTVLSSVLDWVSGRDIVAAAADDPAAFAAAVVGVYRDETLWCSVREGAACCLDRAHSRAGFVENVSAVLSRTPGLPGGG